MKTLKNEVEVPCLSLCPTLVLSQINKKVMGMIEKAEDEYKVLIHKKKVRSRATPNTRNFIGHLR